MEKEELRKRIRRLLGSLIKLVLVLFTLTILDAVFGGLSFTFFGFQTDTSEVLGIIRLIAIVYYGYWILKDSLFFLDILTDVLARRFNLGSSENPRRIGLDFLYLISLSLGWFALSPFLKLVPDMAVRVLSLIFLLLAIVFLYDLVKTVYSILRLSYESLIDALSDIIGRLTESEKSRNKH